MGTLSVEAVMRVGRVVDNVELAGLVVVAVPPVHHSVLVSLLVSELSVVAEKGTGLDNSGRQIHEKIFQFEIR